MTIAAIVGVLTVHLEVFWKCPITGPKFLDLFDYIIKYSDASDWAVNNYLCGYFTSKSALVKELSNNYSLKIICLLRSFIY